MQQEDIELISTAASLLSSCGEIEDAELSVAMADFNNIAAFITTESELELILDFNSCLASLCQKIEKISEEADLVPPALSQFVEIATQLQSTLVNMLSAEISTAVEYGNSDAKTLLQHILLANKQFDLIYEDVEVIDKSFLLPLKLAFQWFKDTVNVDELGANEIFLKKLKELQTGIDDIIWSLDESDILGNMLAELQTQLENYLQQYSTENAVTSNSTDTMPISSAQTSATEGFFVKGRSALQQLALKLNAVAAACQELESNNATVQHELTGLPTQIESLTLTDSSAAEKTMTILTLKPIQNSIQILHNHYLKNAGGQNKMQDFISRLSTALEQMQIYLTSLDTTAEISTVNRSGDPI